MGILSYFGVTVFFVLSGFLITMLLLREYTRTSQIDLGGFYRRRAVRILPASLFYVTIILLLGHPSVIQSVFALTFTTSYFFRHAYLPLQHLWSLSVEEQFYFFVAIGFCHWPAECQALLLGHDGGMPAYSRRTDGHRICGLQLLRARYRGFPGGRMLARILPRPLAGGREAIPRFNDFLPDSLFGHSLHRWRSIQNAFRFALGSCALFNRPWHERGH